MKTYSLLMKTFMKVGTTKHGLILLNTRVIDSTGLKERAEALVS